MAIEVVKALDNRRGAKSEKVTVGQVNVVSPWPPWLPTCSKGDLRVPTPKNGDIVPL